MMLDALFQPVAAHINEPQSLISTSIPCQYWYENAWYNLVPLDGTKPVAYKSTTKIETTSVYYQFCQQLETNPVGVSPNCASKLGYYADVANANNTCTELSTNSKESITMMADGYRNATMTNSSLGIQYTATSGCTLQVGLICGNNTEVMNGPL